MAYLRKKKQLHLNKVPIGTTNRTATEVWWQTQIVKAADYRKKYAFEDRWQEIRQWYEHRFTNPKIPNFNLVYMLGSSLIPNLVFQQPHVVNTPRRAEFQYWARFFDGIDNWLFDEMQMKDNIEDAVISAFLYNFTGLEVGYDFPDEQGSRLEEITFNKIAGIVDNRRRSNRPWIDVIRPEHLLVAAGTKNVFNCRWYAKFVALPTATLKELPNVKDASATSKVVPSEMPDHVSVREGNKWIAEEPEEYTCMWQIHDAERGEYLWLSTKGKIIVPPTPDPLQVNGLPLEVLRFNKSVDTFFGTPDSLYIETQMAEGNEIRRDGRLQRRNAITRGFYDTDLISKDDMERFLSGDPMTMIPVSVGPEKKLSDVLQLTTPHVQSEYWEEKKQLLNDAQLITGVGPNQMGTFAPGRRTAKETGIVKERNELRIGSRRQQVAEFVGRLAAKMNRLIMQNWEGKHVERVLGVDAATYFVEASPAAFVENASHLVTKVAVESLAPTSRDQRRAEMTEVLKILGSFQNIDPFPILNRFLSSFEWSDMYGSLPQAPQVGPMDMGQFQEQQQKQIADPQLPQQIGRNLQGMEQAIGKLPK